MSLGVTQARSSQISAAGGLWFLSPQGLFLRPTHHLVVLGSLVVISLLSRLWAYP